MADQATEISGEFSAGRFSCYKFEPMHFKQNIFFENEFNEKKSDNTSYHTFFSLIGQDNGDGCFDFFKNNKSFL